MKSLRVRTFLFLFALLFLISVPLQAQTADPRLTEIDAYIAKAAQDWNVPGCAVAIVKDDKVVWAKGYGVRKMGESTPVDDHTLFAIASNSKAFTAATLAILVDEGKVKWDDPVTKYLPWFQMYTPYVTHEMTVRDLLCHRSGLATFSGDLLWYETTYTSEEILRRVRYLKPTSSFRSQFGYQNNMFIAAGEIVRVVTGKSWSEFVTERILAPLGMTSTTTTVTAFKPGDNIAAPHNELDGAMRVIRYSNVDSGAAAAGLNSCVADMAEWLRLQLGRGKYQGKVIFSAKNSREMWTAHTLQPISEVAEKLNPTQHFSAYGLGWSLNDYQGRKVISHGGGLDGMISRTAMIPEENLGLVVLTNSETSLATIVSNKIFDVFLGAPQRDWSAEFLELTRRRKEVEKLETQHIEASRIPNTQPSLPLAKYAGKYSGPLYGNATITEENGQLVLRLIPAPNFVGDLEHWHLDTFRLKWRPSVSYPFPKGLVTFTINASGKPTELKIDCPNPDFDFGELELRR
ncbi:MAG: serine hydrolase [Acidobacteria bacterium]|nr:serine hydrolase [Acidobacteriota bacterium]